MSQLVKVFGYIRNCNRSGSSSGKGYSNATADTSCSSRDQDLVTNMRCSFKVGIGMTVNGRSEVQACQAMRLATIFTTRGRGSTNHSLALEVGMMPLCNRLVDRIQYKIKGTLCI